MCPYVGEGGRGAQARKEGKGGGAMCWASVLGGDDSRLLLPSGCTAPHRRDESRTIITRKKKGPHRSFLSNRHGGLGVGLGGGGGVGLDDSLLGGRNIGRPKGAGVATYYQVSHHHRHPVCMAVACAAGWV